jgi:alpha-ketoglutarate-dependent taurine dioxygenase
MLEVREKPGAFAVTHVLGVRPDAGPEIADELRALLAKSAVLRLALERKLGDDELQAVARLFGPIKDPVGHTKDGGTLQYAPKRQVIDSGFVLSDDEREKRGDTATGGLDDQRPGLFETFHVDDTYTEEPAGATVLHARELPPSGGGPTCFIDMRAALELLPEATRRRIEGVRVRYAHNNEDAFPPRRAARGPNDALVEVTHPLVRTHPVARTRSLFLDLDRAKHIEGMSVPDGRALLRELQQHAETHAPGCEHDWSPHDVLIWDNVSVQHKAGGNFKLGEPRRFWRYMIAGTRPV